MLWLCGVIAVVIRGAKSLDVCLDRQAPIFPTRLDKKTLLPETSQIPKEKPLTPNFRGHESLTC